MHRGLVVGQANPAVTGNNSWTDVASFLTYYKTLHGPLVVNLECMPTSKHNSLWRTPQLSIPEQTRRCNTFWFKGTQMPSKTTEAVLFRKTKVTSHMVMTNNDQMTAAWLGGAINFRSAPKFHWGLESLPWSLAPPFFPAASRFDF